MDRTRSSLQKFAASYAVLFAALFVFLSSLICEHNFYFAAPGDTVVFVDFDDGGLDGFMTYVNTGSCELENEDGKLAVKIASCGTLDYANQAYLDGFALNENCAYTYSFDVSCDIERDLEYRLQLNGGDYHAYCSDRITVGPQETHISIDWVMNEPSDPAPRIVFNMGLQDNMQEDPGTHTVRLDNISLVILDDSKAVQAQALPDLPMVSADQEGYLPEDEKTLFFRSGSLEGVSFTVENASGQIVLEGNASETFFDSATGSRMCRGDFSALTQPGTYMVSAYAGNEKIGETQITIADDVYRKLYRDVVRMLSLQRCGCAIDEAADPLTGDFSHPACHLQEALIYGTSRTKDVSGGWHDAGDYGRYVVSGAKAAADLLFAFEYFGIDDDDLGIPESGNQVPDLLDEARYELEWMLKMQDEESGGVYHKVTGYSFPGEVMPQEETDPLVIAPISLTATGDFAALMAKASILFRPYDAAFADQMLSASEKAWSYGKDLSDSTGFLNPVEISTGEYPDRLAADELFWAAVELFRAGVITAEDVTAHFPDYLKPGLGWQRMTSYGLFPLAFSEDTPLDLKERAASLLLDDAQAIKEAIQKDGYYMTMGTSYPWGSNMSAANNGMTLLMAWKLTGEEEFRTLAKRQLDYLLGANALGYCFVTGEGSFSPEHPHHRPSQAAGHAVPGMLVGGPNSNLEDPFARGVLKDLPAALCYADNDQTYSTNEVAVYWNSPLIVLLSEFR